MKKPTSNLTATDKEFANALVRLANSLAERIHRLSTVDKALTDDFVASTFENAEVVFAVWRESDLIGFLPVKGSIDNLANPTPGDIAAVWVENRAMANAMKKAMKLRGENQRLES